MKEKVAITQATSIGGDESVDVLMTRQQLIDIIDAADRMRRAIAPVDKAYNVEAYELWDDVHVRQWVDLDARFDIGYPEKLGVWEVTDDANGPMFSWTILKVSNRGGSFVTMEMSDDYDKYEVTFSPEYLLEQLEKYDGGSDE